MAIATVPDELLSQTLCRVADDEAFVHLPLACRKWRDVMDAYFQDAARLEDWMSATPLPPFRQLLCAVLHGHSGIAERLVRTSKEDFLAAITWAARHHTPALVTLSKMLTLFTPRLFARDDARLRVVLTTAARKGDATSLALLLEGVGDTNWFTEGALVMASRNGHLACVRIIHEFCERASVPSYCGFALVEAAWFGHLPVVMYLRTQYKPSDAFPDDTLPQAMCVAVQRGHTEVASFLGSF